MTDTTLPIRDDGDVPTHRDAHGREAHEQRTDGQRMDEQRTGKQRADEQRVDEQRTGEHDASGHGTGADPRADRRTDKQRKARSAKLFVRDILIIFVIALLASVLIKTFLIRSFYIPSSSMENTLMIDDRIIVNELEPTLIPIKHGDVVVFRDPGGWLDPHTDPAPNPVVAAVDWVLAAVGLSAPDSNDHLVKRVIGLPGDEVACCTPLGQLSINGVPIKEPYILIRDGMQNAASVTFDVTVPPDSLWVMGDNRYNSKDSSRNQDLPGKGFVPIDHVVGRAFVLSWPMDRWRWLDNYPSVFQGVEDNDAVSSIMPLPRNMTAGSTR